jgi:DsbC/DsbD-like thiol-disulfide interchange protein
MKSSRKLIIKPISLLMGVALLLMTHAAYAITVSYTYDELGRLTKAAYSNNNFISYTYDSVGNITDITTSGDVDAPVVSTAQNITVAATDANGTEASHAQITAFLTAATASDVIDGQLAPSNDAPTTFPLGTTTVTFSATDSSNNAGTAQATVTVTDQTKPIISLTGNSSITLNVGDSYSDQGATAIDNVDGDKTAAIQTSSTVNTAQVGQYTVTYTVSDAAGNAATAVTRSITVQDADAPVVSTAQNITVAATDANGTEASNAQITAFLTAATASDVIDGQLAPSNDAPTTFPLGTTTVMFSATDSSNNTGTAQATVTVTDQTKPIITLTGNSSITLNIGDSYTDQGATAEDNVDGNITANILVSNTVNINVVNTYSVTYSVSDAVGNATTPVIRQVSIIELDLNQIDTDGDGVNDNVDAFINDASASVDTDEDGQPDTINGTSTTGLTEDLDDDNDGIPDIEEETVGLNPLDSTDAENDADGDGVSNLDEFNNGSLGIDDIAPTFTAPEDINITASGYLTAIDLRRIEVIDSKDGVLSAQVDKTGPFKSGRHIITWIVRDQAGNATTDTQTVNITPLVRLPIDLIVGEGTRISIPIVLSGLAVHYPVVMNYTIGGTTDGNDHNAINGDISIEEGKQTELTIEITDDVVADPNETIVITLGNPQNAALTSDTQMQITIIEENIAPIANFVTNQNGMATRRVNRLDGNVTINSNVLDPNANEVHSYDWSLTDNNLVDIDNDDSTFTFDPTNIAPGLYQIALKVTDSDGLSSQIARTIRVFAAVITLSTEQDTDGDGISDAVEGSGDSDGDGIADYQDDASQPTNVMPLPSGKTMEVADGLQIKVGHNAFGGNSKTATTTLGDIANYGSAAGGVTTTDNDFTPQSIIFDFAISGLAQPGDKASIVMPLETPLPANAIYRKFLANEGWVTLAKGDDYNIESALSEAVSGLCPDVNSNVFTDGLTEGDDCIKLTLVDGGRFDGDGSVNGVIEDPGVIVTDKAEATSANVVTDGISVSSGGGGGAMSYKLFLLMFFLYVLGQSINRKRLNTYFLVTNISSLFRLS